MNFLKRLVDWFERKGLWGLTITFIVIAGISLTYYYEKQWERNSGPDEFGIYSQMEFYFIDMRHEWLFDPEASDDDIVIVTITETALDRYKEDFGRWPWPRRVMAKVVQYLSQADSILLDIGFMEPSGKEIDPRQASKMRQLIDEATKLREKAPRKARRYFRVVDRKLRRLSVSGDRRLGMSLKKNGPAVTATWFVNVTEGKLTSQQYSRLESLTSEFGYRLEGNETFFPTLSYALPPIEPILKRSYGLAHISFTPDPDGPARRFAPFMGVRNRPEQNVDLSRRYLPILGLAGALEQWELHPGESSFTVDNRTLEVGPRTVPLDRKGRVLIRYKGGLRPRGSIYSSYREVPIEDIVSQLLEGQTSNGLSPEFFKGKKVLVGSTAAGAHDLRATPFSAQEAGVVVHANILDMFLNNDFLRPIRTRDTLLMVGLWSLTVGLVASTFTPLIALIITILLTGLLVVMGMGLFNQGYLINLSAPLLSSYLTYGLVTVYNLVFEQRKRRQVRNAFESYLTSSVMEEVLENPDELELGGERREITVMFADISGFTSFSEGRTATEVASVIGEVMTELTDCVFHYQGVLDKYIGDELVAEFGIVPGEPDNHAKRAVEAAVDMLDRLEELQEEWREAGQVVLDLRIGLHTGPAATGNMGSEMLFDYTAIGDNVNLGSRLEGANKQYGSRCMISEATYGAADDIVEVRELDKIIVKGKEEPVVVYELLGRKGEVNQEMLALRDRFEEGLRYYRNRSWDDAIAVFEDLLESYEEDDPSRVFLDRCREYREDPPPEDWDGAFKLTSK